MERVEPDGALAKLGSGEPPFPGNNPTEACTNRGVSALRFDEGLAFLGIDASPEFPGHGSSAPPVRRLPGIGYRPSR
jgi:hypothetical protein